MITAFYVFMLSALYIFLKRFYLEEIIAFLWPKQIIEMLS